MKKKIKRITVRKAKTIKEVTNRKPRAISVGFCSHDCEAHYKCPVCDKNFGSWTIFGQKENENGTKHYCPHCKTELEGLE